MRTTFAAAFLLLTVGFAPSAGLAQTESSATLTRDELRACMQQEAALKGRNERHGRDVAQHNEEAASITAENANLIRASVNGFKDKAARDAFSARQGALNKRVEAFNARGRQVRLALADIQSSQADYLRKCGGKAFLVDDRNAIVAEGDGAMTPPRPGEPAASTPR